MFVPCVPTKLLSTDWYNIMYICTVHIYQVIIYRLIQHYVYLYRAYLSRYYLQIDTTLCTFVPCISIKLLSTDWYIMYICTVHTYRVIIYRLLQHYVHLYRAYLSSYYLQIDTLCIFVPCISIKLLSTDWYNIMYICTVHIYQVIIYRLIQHYVYLYRAHLSSYYLQIDTTLCMFVPCIPIKLLSTDWYNTIYTPRFKTCYTVKTLPSGFVGGHHRHQRFPTPRAKYRYWQLSILSCTHNQIYCAWQYRQLPLAVFLLVELDSSEDGGDHQRTVLEVSWL